MIELKQTGTFQKWWKSLKDERAVAVIFARLGRLAHGLAGDVKPVGEGISELSVDYGPGYRVYFKRRGSTIIVLLCGGDKRTQDEYIKLAKQLASSGANHHDRKTHPTGPRRRSYVT